MLWSKTAFCIYSFRFAREYGKSSFRKYVIVSTRKFIDQNKSLHINFKERCFTNIKVYTQMKDLEIDLPPKKDTTVIARIKRLHFYSVREEFINVWKQHEQFLIDYEEKIKRELQHQAKISKFPYHVLLIFLFQSVFF